MEVTFKGTLSKDDYLKAHKLHNPHKKLRPLLAILIPPMIIVGVIDFSKNQEISFLFLLLILFWMVGLLYVRYRIRKYWSQSKAIKEHLSGSVSDKGIMASSKISNSNLTWDYFIKYRLSSEMVLLYQADNMMNIFPRFFFENDSDWESFVEIVKNNIPSK